MSFKKNFIYLIFEKFIYNFLIIYYPITIINKDKIYNKEKSCIYISRHTTHNWELLLGLFTLNKYSNKIIRGLGHYLIFILCPYYYFLGVVRGTKNNALELIKNNEYLFIIPGGGEEMTIGSENFKKTYWISKSKKYKTGFAKLAYDNNIPIIPIHSHNVEFMVFSPGIFLANKLYLTKLYSILMDNINSLYFYKILFYIKMAFTLLFGSYLVIPIPINMTLKIGEHIYKKDNEDLISYTKRCEIELNSLLKSDY